MKDAFQINKWNRKENSLTALFFCSLAISMFFVVMKREELLSQTDILSMEMLSMVGCDDVNNSLFLAVLMERVALIPILFLVSTTYLAGMFVHGVVLFYGFSVGTLFAIAMLRYKIGGVVFLLLCAMPQYILYLPAFLIALRLTMEERVPDRKFFLQLCALEGMILVGCFLESYVNSFFVKKIIYFFMGV